MILNLSTLERVNNKYSKAYKERKRYYLFHPFYEAEIL